MRPRLLTRIIERASDPLASAIYRRILDDRRAAKGQPALAGTPTTWEQIVASAMDERVLNPAEAEAFLTETRRGQMAVASCVTRNRGWWQRRATLRIDGSPRPRSAL